MCGIAGIIHTKPAETPGPEIRRMTDAIAHRGLDGEGHWTSEDATVALGHRRLSIIDLSESANQPMHFGNRYSIVFNGEIYNFPELKEELIANGYSFKTSSDTEVLLALYDQKKDKCLQDLDGMFAFAIWDNNEKSLFCARDRFGEKPFFFAFHNDVFYFASEMKALWAVGVPKDPCPERIYNYLAFGRLDDISTHSTTFFQNIHQLEPAHCFYLENGQISKKKKYWEIDLSLKSKVTFEEAQEKFIELFERSVKRRLRSDVPVGSSLSGGLDSSSIVMTVNKMKPDSQVQKTFSARFEGFERDEGKFIDLVSAYTETEPHHVFLEPESLEAEMEKVAFHQEEPFGSTSIVAQWNVMKLAAENDTTVLLDGQGADEYLAGYQPFFHAYFTGEYRRNKAVFNSLVEKYEAFYGIPFEKGRFFGIHTRFPNLRNNLRTWKNKLNPPAYLKQFNKDFLASNKFADFKSAHPRNLSESLIDSLQSSSLPTLLRYADRNSMAHSREVRLPFLSHELVEFVFSLPDDFKIRDCWTKAVLRFGMQDLLPQEICWRKEKVGFEPPKNRSVDPEQLKAAIEVLVEKKILHPDHILPEKSWEYVQISFLYR